MLEKEDEESKSLKRKSELYDPACPDDDSDEEEEEEKEVEKEEDKPIEPAAKIQKVPIKLAIPTTIGKRTESDKTDNKNNGDATKTTTTTTTTSSSVRLCISIFFTETIINTKYI